MCCSTAACYPARTMRVVPQHILRSLTRGHLGENSVVLRTPLPAYKRRCPPTLVVGNTRQQGRLALRRSKIALVVLPSRIFVIQIEKRVGCNNLSAIHLMGRVCVQVQSYESAKSRAVSSWDNNYCKAMIKGLIDMPPTGSELPGKILTRISTR
jgi:hypothetical protein